MKGLAAFAILTAFIFTSLPAGYALEWELYEPGPVTEEDRAAEKDSGPEEVKVLSLKDLKPLSGRSK